MASLTLHCLKRACVLAARETCRVDGSIDCTIVRGTSMAIPPALPKWESAPADPAGAIREIKAAIRGRMEALGTTVEDAFQAIEQRIAARVTESRADTAAGESSWTVLDFDDIRTGDISAEQLAHLTSSGCLVVRGHFGRDQALAWDRDIVDYVESNDFFEVYRGPGDDFFDSVSSKPEIYPIYWSGAQMEARQSERMATVQSFLNHRWTFHGEGEQWFDRDRHAMYPDRIRRRPPGTDSNGLGPHTDTGTLDLWMTKAYQDAFRHVFDGAIDRYDPWDASYRTAGGQYDGSTMCSAFRTFQGWTALCDMRADQGVLRSVPIPEAMAYVLLRPLLPDIDDDDMCGVQLNRALPISEEHHPLLTQAFSRIPDVQAGDSVWWHCDIIHGVEPVTQQQGWGNVMYIPSAPWCERNERYALRLRDAFLSGASPGDFPAEHYEQTWANRFQQSQLNEAGRAAFVLG